MKKISRAEEAAKLVYNVDDSLRISSGTFENFGCSQKFLCYIYVMFFSISSKLEESLQETTGGNVIAKWRVKSHHSTPCAEIFLGANFIEEVRRRGWCRRNGDGGRGKRAVLNSLVRIVDKIYEAGGLQVKWALSGK